MRTRTTTLALLLGVSLLSGCATKQTTPTDARLDRIETSIAELQTSNQQLTAYAQRLDAYLFQSETESSGNSAYTSSLISQLQTVRSQIELYKNQHNDQAPNILQSWDQLTHYTDIDGKIDKGVARDDSYRYGPYLQRALKNPFNDSSVVTRIDHLHPDAGWAWDPKEQMFYAVVSNELAVEMDLDNYDVETFSSKAFTFVSEMRGDLAVLRNAIDLYATEHKGTFPSLQSITAQITTYTDQQGLASKQKSGNTVYGPYLRKVPDNPFTAKIGFSPLDEPSVDSAWAYDEKTGEILAVIPAGSIPKILEERVRADSIAPAPATAAVQP